MLRDKYNLYFSFCAILCPLAPPPPPNSPPKKRKEKKMKKKHGNILILHMRTKNYDHMMYGS